MPNVFISHRGSDQVSAEKLANQMRAAGHSVWLDTWSIEVGDQIGARRCAAGWNACQTLA